MPSTVDICNQALTKLGASRITALADDTRNARALNAIFDVKRDAELASYPWTFAIKRARLAALATAPAFGWQRQFPLPTDCLRLVQVGTDWAFYASDGGELFQIEADSVNATHAVLTDQSAPLDVRYVYRVTNAGLFPALFVEALACRLAAELAEELTQNLGKRDAAWKEHRQAILLAKRANAIEQPPQRMPDLSWVQALG